MGIPPTPAGRATEEHDSWVHRTLGYVVRRATEAETRAAAVASSAADTASRFLHQPATEMMIGVQATGAAARAIGGEAVGNAVVRVGTAMVDTAFGDTAGAVGRQVAAAVEQAGGRAVVQAAATETAVATGEAAVAVAPVVAGAAVVGGVVAAGARIAQVEARDGLHNPPPSDETAGVNGDGSTDASADPPPR